MREAKSYNTSSLSFLEFHRTGHFWIDLGIIALWRIISENPHTRRMASNKIFTVYHNCNCTLSPAKLTLEGDVSAALRAARGYLHAQVWEQTKRGKQWWSPLATFYFQGQTSPSTFLADYETIGAGDKFSSKRNCNFCSSTQFPVRPCGRAYIPFLVDLGKMASFYSGLKTQYYICQNCAFVAPFAVLRCFFNLNLQDSLCISMVPENPNLIKLDELYQTTGKFFATATRHRNYPQQIQDCERPLQSFLDFLCSAWDLMKKQRTFDTGGFEGTRFHVLLLDKQGNEVSPKRYYIIPDALVHIELIKSCEHVHKGKTWNSLVEVMSSVYWTGERNQVDTFLREELAHRITERSPLDDVLENFLFELALVRKEELEKRKKRKFNTRAFYLFLRDYGKEVYTMDDDTKRALESVGQTIGHLVVKTEDKGILYTLRNTRNEDDLLDFLFKVLARHASKFVEGEVTLYRNAVHELSEKTSPTNWRRFRSLLGIYAVLKYIEDMIEKMGKEGKRQHKAETETQESD